VSGWFLFAAVVPGWLLQMWLASRQTPAQVRETARLRTLGSVAVGKGGRRYRGGVAFVSLAPDGRRVTGALDLRGSTTFARPVEVPALVGLRLGVAAGDRPLEGLKGNERVAAREAAGCLRSACGAAQKPTATSGGGGGKPVITRRDRHHALSGTRTWSRTSGPGAQLAPAARAGRPPDRPRPRRSGRPREERPWPPPGRPGPARRRTADGSGARGRVDIAFVPGWGA
jgi:DNA-binding transcriptional regulator of glucitol operon